MTRTIKVLVFKREDGTIIRRIRQKTKVGWVETDEPMSKTGFNTDELPDYMRPSKEVSD